MSTARTAEPLPDATAPLAFLERWSEPDKAVFFRFVAEQEALHKDLTLYQLNAKIARQSGLMWHNTPDKCRMTDDGKLSVAAMLHATLLALRQCIPVAMLKEQAEHETRLARMQVRRNAQALVTCADAFVFNLNTQQVDTEFLASRMQNEATPAHAAKRPKADNAGSAQKKQKSGAAAVSPDEAKEAAEAASPQLGAEQSNGHRCDPLIHHAMVSYELCEGH